MRVWMDQLDERGLRPGVARLLPEEHLAAHVDGLEVMIRDRVAVEVDFPAVGRLDEAVGREGKELRDPAAATGVVRFLLAPHAADVILQPAAGRREGVAECDVHVFVRVVEMVIAVDHDLAAGHADVDPDGIEPSEPMVTVRLRDHDVAAGDAVAEALEPADVLEGSVTHALVDGDVVEGDLGLGLHRSGGGGRIWTDAHSSLRREKLRAPAQPRLAAAGNRHFLAAAALDTRGRRPWVVDIRTRRRPDKEPHQRLGRSRKGS